MTHEVMEITIGALHSCPDHALGVVGPAAWTREPRTELLEWRAARLSSFQIPPENGPRSQVLLALPYAVPVARVNVVAWGHGDPLQIQLVPLDYENNPDLVRDQLIVTPEFFADRDVIGQFTFSSLEAFSRAVIHPMNIRDAQVLVGAEVVVVGAMPTRGRAVLSRALLAGDDVIAIEGT